MVVKKVTKKTSTVSAKSRPKKNMVTVSGEMCFWVNNGPILSNLKDLESALSHMTDDQYRHHVSKTKNDFASWVRGSLEDTNCAVSLKRAKTKSEATSCVKRALALYK